jgi:peptidoglycan/xylan/chitin deacetylase (PgdA/CDA1 family)
MTRDERRTARLLFADELARGVVRESDLDTPEVGRAVAVRRVPSRPRRLAQRLAMKRGRLSLRSAVIAPARRARDAVLGAGASGPPRLLIRIDEFPHATAFDSASRFGTDAYARFHAILRDAGVPYLVAVMPRVALHPLEPDEPQSRALTDPELALLARLRDDGVAFACHGLDHRTRHHHPRRHSELCGLGPAALGERLDQAQAIIAGAGLSAPALVPPYNRFDAGQWDALAARFAVITGGPESVALLGFRPGPQWRGEAVYLPSYPPLYGSAGDVLAGLQAIGDDGAGLWLSITLHWAWEADQGFSDLQRLVAHVAAGGAARPWSELYAAMQASAVEPAP